MSNVLPLGAWKCVKRVNQLIVAKDCKGFCLNSNSKHHLVKSCFANYHA